MSNSSSSVLKILLALDLSDQSRLASKLALTLAINLGADLEGLFFEDEEILDSSLSPYAIEIFASSGREKKPNYVDLERSLRAWSTQLQQQLIKQAGLVNVKCSFRTVRGYRDHIIQENIGANSVFVMAGARATLFKPSFDALTIYILVNDVSELQKCRKFINELIHSSPSNILFIDCGNEQTTASIDQLIGELLAGGNVADSIKAGEDLLSSVEILLKKHPGRVLVIPGSHSIIKTPGKLDLLRKKVICPVVVLN